MLRLSPSNFLRPILVACLLFSVRCFAQFEVAPDHFDVDQAQNVPSTIRGNDKANAAKTKAHVRAPQPAPKRVLQKSALAERQAAPAQFRGQALTIYQRELDRVQSLLATAFHVTEVTLAHLQAELNTRVQSAANRHLATVTIVSLQPLR